MIKSAGFVAAIVFFTPIRQHTTWPTDMGSIVYKIKASAHSTCKVIIDHISSVGRAVATANWSTLRGHASIPSVLALIFQLLFQLAWWKLNMCFIQSQTEKLQALHCEFSTKYGEYMLFLCANLTHFQRVFCCQTGRSFDSYLCLLYITP